MTEATHNSADRKALQFAMTLSLGIGIFMFVIKWAAYLLTGSAAILSDAAESVVHVVAVCFAAYSLRVTYRPADVGHLYGHTKISFFSAGFEGAMIAIAALYIIFESVRKWTAGIGDHATNFSEAMHWLWSGGGLHLENLGFGTILTVVAMTINAGLGGYLIWLGKKKGSIILEANGKHVLTDVWTSLGVIIGLVLALWTQWQPWDPIFAIFVAMNILYSGSGLIRRSVGGLMDKADPKTHQKLIEILDTKTQKYGITYHGLRHRNIGDAHWVEVHLLFPAETPLGTAHGIATRIEEVIEDALEPGSQVATHLESIEDHREVHRTPDAH